MKKQSSIDILVNAIYERFGIANCGDMEEEIQQAKKMHKQEIIEAYEEGQNTPYEYSEDNDVNYYDGRNYYKTTYEKEN